MSENAASLIDQFEQTFKDNPRLIQFLTEQQRFKQQARLRALDLTFQRNLPSQIEDSLVEANTYYNWLIEILPDKLF